MKGWPHGSDRIPTGDVSAGDIVVVAGLGAFVVRQVLDVRPLGRVALLGWDSLALILRPGTAIERLRPAPGAPHRPGRCVAAAASPTGGDPSVRPALPLAG
jgi:hypothetical protein